MNDKRKVAFYTLGCKLNFSETSTISRLFGENDFEKVEFNETADIYVINTCSVTGSADKKCRQAIKKCYKQSPDAYIAVVGCYAQLKPDEIVAIPGVDIVLGANEKFNIIDHLNKLESKDQKIVHSCDIDEIEKFDASYSIGDRTRSFLKVQDGCDYKCTYCTIPLARGKSRNTTIKETVNEAKKIAETEIKEIILTGVNIGDFGRSTEETFFDLVKELDKVEGIERFRISSIEPNLISDEIIDFVSTSKRFVPHFHIPLQSGCDKILKLMQRRYLRDVFAKKVEKIKELIPQACIAADVIVGFPGETDEDFNDTYSFIESLDVSALHVFSYSERDNTKSADMTGKVNPKTIAERSQKLHKLSDLKLAEFYKKHLGTDAKVLFEASKSKGKMFGFTDNYIKVETEYNKELANQIVSVTLNEITDNGNVSVTIK